MVTKTGCVPSGKLSSSLAGGVKITLSVIKNYGQTPYFCRLLFVYYLAAYFQRNFNHFSTTANKYCITTEYAKQPTTSPQVKINKKLYEYEWYNSLERIVISG